MNIQDLKTRHMNNNLSKSHVIAFLGIWGVFTVLTFLIADAGVDQGSGHEV